MYYQEVFDSAGLKRRSVVSVQVCDGCCCGTERKHPGVDHARIRALIAAAVDYAGGRLRVVDCVDECSRSNVVIVRPAGSRSERIWIGGVLDDEVVQALCGWIAVGATTPKPFDIATRVFQRANQAGANSNTAPVELRISR